MQINPSFGVDVQQELFISTKHIIFQIFDTVSKVYNPVQICYNVLN